MLISNYYSKEKKKQGENKTKIKLCIFILLRTHTFIHICLKIVSLNMLFIKSEKFELLHTVVLGREGKKIMFVLLE